MSKMKTIIKRLYETTIPFIINDFLSDSSNDTKSNKLKAFDRLEASRNKAKTLIDYNAEREKSMNEKYGM